MKSITEVLKYKNPRVTEKFREDFYFDATEADLIFRETITWLWLAAKSSDDAAAAMYHPMLVMDKMWHTFLSFSRDYDAFCKSELGRFVHHEPHTRSESVRNLTPTTENPDPLSKIYSEISAFQNHVYETLGAETLLRWFVEFPSTYSPDELQRRVRPQFSQRGFMRLTELRSLGKEDLLTELSKDHAIAAWCGGHDCGPYCKEP